MDKKRFPWPGLLSEKEENRMNVPVMSFEPERMIDWCGRQITERSAVLWTRRRSVTVVIERAKLVENTFLLH